MSTNVDFWSKQRVLLTGGAGFLGLHVASLLKRLGCCDIYIPRSADHDLREQQVVRRVLGWRPDVVIHLAATVGGIGANRDNPGRFFYDNIIMGAMLLEEARKVGVKKFVTVGTTCSYPKHCPLPFRELDIWNGYPEETNAPYGIAKKALLSMALAYRQQYHMNAVYLIPANLYGPGDNFDLYTSHVIPALIRKCLENHDEIVVWGTGKPTREFLYVEDAAQAILLAAERYNGSDPINIGTGQEISIRDLVRLIVRTTGFRGNIVFDESQPDGQPRRRLDTGLAKEKLGWTARVDIEDGLARTVEWYTRQCFGPEEK